MSTYMWKLEGHIFRFQTNNPKIARMLSKRKTMILVAWGMNKYLRIFQIENLRPDNARRMLRYIKTQELNLKTVKCQTDEKTYSQMTINQLSQSSNLRPIGNKG